MAVDDRMEPIPFLADEARTGAQGEPAVFEAAPMPIGGAEVEDPADSSASLDVQAPPLLEPAPDPFAAEPAVEPRETEPIDVALRQMVDSLDAPAPVDEPEPTPVAEEVPANTAEFEAKLETLTTTVQQLDEVIRHAWRRDELARTTFDALHEELKGYKEDFIVKAQMPMLKALVRLLDDLDDMVRRGEPVPTKDIEYLGVQVQEVLFDYGAEEVGVQCGAPFDGTRHSALRTQPDPDAAKKGMVAEVLGRGWLAQGRVIRKQNVVVYVSGVAASAEAPDEPVVSEPVVEPVPAIVADAAVNVQVEAPGAEESSGTDSAGANDGLGGLS